MKYNQQLDGLRCVAVMMVMFSHFHYIGSQTAFGFLGVDLFFVLSGFLITSILISTEEPFGKAYKTFIGRRSLRIFPIYYLLIIGLLIAGNEAVNNYKGLLLTYTYNYVRLLADEPANEISHTWSLGVEEQFYLIWPFFALLFRKNLTALKAIAVVTMFVCALQFAFDIFPGVIPFNYSGLFPRAFSLCLGAFGAIMYREKALPVALLESKIAEGLVFLVLCYAMLFSFQRFHFLFLPAISLYLIFKICYKGFHFRPLNWFMKHRIVVYLGTISYGMYLYHKVIKHYFEKYVFDPYNHHVDFNSWGFLGRVQYYPAHLTMPINIVLTIIVASISYHLIEKPILRLKEKWFPYKKASKKIANRLFGPNSQISVASSISES
jgi:peptidoglycan/LPS O-acetylase OafA/YrhL